MIKKKGIRAAAVRKDDTGRQKIKTEDVGDRPITEHTKTASCQPIRRERHIRDVGWSKHTLCPVFSTQKQNSSPHENFKPKYKPSCIKCKKKNTWNMFEHPTCSNLPFLFLENHFPPRWRNEIDFHITSWRREETVWHKTVNLIRSHQGPAEHVCPPWEEYWYRVLLVIVFVKENMDPLPTFDIEDNILLMLWLFTCSPHKLWHFQFMHGC